MQNVFLSVCHGQSFMRYPVPGGGDFSLEPTDPIINNCYRAYLRFLISTEINTLPDKVIILAHHPGQEHRPLTIFEFTLAH